mgnify:CR=1 FL=1
MWTVTEFSTREDFRDFLLSIFKEPGKYNFNETAYLFNEQARLYEKNKFYCVHPRNTKDYVKYWNDQKDKCRFGVIFKSKEAAGRIDESAESLEVTLKKYLELYLKELLPHFLEYWE